MAIVKRTVAEFLKELKVLDSRITNGIKTAIFCGVKVGPRLPLGFASQDDFEKSVKAGMESIEGLIKNRANIKSAIILSNAGTPVTVANVTMTVAEAIERKSSIQYQKTLLQDMEVAYSRTLTFIDKGNSEVKVRLDQLLLASRGKDGTVNVEADASTTKAFLENNELVLLDPLQARKSIEKLRDDILAFEANVDTQLSISNAVTMIEVTL